MEKKTVIKFSVDFECKSRQYTTQFKIAVNSVAPYTNAENFIAALVGINNENGWEEFVLKSHEQMEFQNCMLKAEMREQRRLSNQCNRTSIYVL